MDDPALDSAQPSPGFVPARPEDLASMQPAAPAHPSVGSQLWDSLKTYDPTIGILSGTVKEAQKHVAGALDLLNKYVIAPNDPGATDTTRRASEVVQHASDWLRKSTDQTTALEKVGGWGENAAELLLPEMWGGKAVEGMSAADRLLEMGKNAKILEKNPGLARVLRMGVAASKSAAKAGTTLGAQQFVESGGDPDKAKEAALTGALTGGVLGGAGAGVSELSDAITSRAASAVPDVAKIGDAEIPRVAEGAPGKVQAAQAEAQQEGVQQSFSSVVNNAVRKTLQPYDIDPQPANHFGDASRQLAKAATTDFDELAARAENLHGEDVGARVRELNQAVNDAPMAGRAAAKQELFSYLDSIDDPRYPDSLRDVAVRARNTYEKKFMADDLHSMLGRYFNYATPQTAEMMEQPYKLELAGKGDNMKDALRKLEDDYGHDGVKDFLGKDGFKNLHDMADVVSEPTYSQNADSILRQVLRGASEGKKGKWVPSSLISTFAGLPFMKTLGALKVMGATKGGVEAALPMLKYQIATNPRLGTLLTYAAKKGVSAQYAAPLINAALYGEWNSQNQTNAQPTPGAQPNADNQ